MHLDLVLKYSFFTFVILIYFRSNYFNFYLMNNPVFPSEQEFKNSFFRQISFFFLKQISINTEIDKVRWGEIVRSTSLSYTLTNHRAYVLLNIPVRNRSVLQNVKVDLCIHMPYQTRICSELINYYLVRKFNHFYDFL